MALPVGTRRDSGLIHGALWHSQKLRSGVYAFALIVAQLTFQKWKKLLRKDCIARDKLPAFNTLDEIVLNILYENGIEPTVDALVNKGLPGPEKKSATGGVQMNEENREGGEGNALTRSPASDD